MKAIIEIKRTRADEGKTGPWLRLAGRDHRGKNVNAVVFGPKATALTKELLDLVPEGEEIANRRLLIELVGQFKDGQFVRDGRTVKTRTLHVDSYKVLTGPTLELARLRRDAEAVLDKAEELRKAGDFQGGYRVLAEYAAAACNRSIDLINSAEAVEDEVFGDPEPTAEETDTPASEPVGNPEAEAAAIYAAEDAALSQAADGPEISPAPTHSQEVPSVTEDQPGTSETTEQERDVLDDNVGESEQRAEQKTETEAEELTGTPKEATRPITRPMGLRRGLRPPLARLGR